MEEDTEANKMITSDEALHALWTLNRELCNRLDDEQVSEEEYLFVDNQFSIVRGFITQQPEVEVVYEYKLRRADGQLLDKDYWNDKGKTYAKRRNLISALGRYISGAMATDPNKPRFIYRHDDYVRGIITRDQYDELYAEYREASNAWYKKAREDKEWRSQFIPEDWTVLAIPVNTTAPIVEINAREWYKGSSK